MSPPSNPPPEYSGHQKISDRPNPTRMATNQLCHETTTGTRSAEPAAAGLSVKSIVGESVTEREVLSSDQINGARPRHVPVFLHNVNVQGIVSFVELLGSRPEHERDMASAVGRRQAADGQLLP